MIIDILNAKTGKEIASLTEVATIATIGEIKQALYAKKPSLKPSRQALKLEQRGKALKDSDRVDTLGLRNGAKLYFKDLGPQVSWVGVFLAEYAGPLVLYVWIYTRPAFMFGAEAATQELAPIVRTAMYCYAGHYVKRLLETLFVHRFSHGTMPLMNLFKNCSYYWGFTLYVAYHVNHPLYTAPNSMQSHIALAAFIVSELGNFSIHWLLRNLRPAGSKERRIPFPTSNPLTAMFNFVSCPNYTYEVAAWLSFTVMTQCLPAGMFAVAGMVQMSIWALAKHRNYKKEFSNYPKSRRAIIPLIL